MASALSKRAAAHPSKILKDDALDYTDDDAVVDYLLDQQDPRFVLKRLFFPKIKFANCIKIWSQK